jgi:hypothetical protein
MDSFTERGQLQKTAWQSQAACNQPKNSVHVHAHANLIFPTTKLRFRTVCWWKSWDLAWGMDGIPRPGLAARGVEFGLPGIWRNPIRDPATPLLVVRHVEA